MQNIERRIKELETVGAGLMKPVRDWSTPDLCQYLAQVSSTELGRVTRVFDPAILQMLIAAIREHAPTYAIG